MPKTLINFRDERGLGAFPNETPLVYQLFANVKKTITLSGIQTPPIVGDFIVFLDLSKWQGNIDFELMYSRGIRAVWIKVSQGEWIDQRFQEYVQGALDAGLYVGFYHFADPEQTSVTPEFAAESTHSLIAGIPTLSLWLDCERAGNLSPSGLLNYYVRFWERYFELDNFQIVYECYTRFGLFNRIVERSDFWRNHNFRVNAARYHLGLQSPWSDGNYIPLDWDFTLINFDEWQYWADGNHLGHYFGCESDSVDVNAFKGTLNEFLVVYNVQAPPPLPECPKLKARILNSEGLRFRKEPNTRSTTWFVLPQYYEFDVIEEVTIGSNIWLRTGEQQYCAKYYNGKTYCQVFEV